MDIKYQKARKLLKIEIQDPAFGTAFQPHMLAEMLTDIYNVLDANNSIKFQYYKEGGSWGFKTVKKDKK